MHEFPLKNHWEGSTAGDYQRAGTLSAPGHPDVAASAGTAYGGDADRWNPEELLGAALSECHKLTFLALAKKARVDVRRYDDDVMVFLDAVDNVTRVTQIRLRTTIAIAAGDPETAKTLYLKAHKYCFVGNSITAEVVMEPTVVAA